MQLKSFAKLFNVQKQSITRQWLEFLRFPSISASDKHHHDCINCAKWLVRLLREKGFHAKLLKTPSKPIVFAYRKGNSSKPVVLIYGHYDVQPVDPLPAWESPPFEPIIKNGRVFARGAEDNKGQLTYTLSAIHSLIKSGYDLPTIKILIDGEEECGSRGISFVLPKLKKLIKADVLLVPDTNTVQDGTPTIVLGLRGIIHLTVEISGPNHDLHSGVHGGIAPNPAVELARLIASLHDKNGNIAVKSFMDDIIPISKEEKELLRRYKFNTVKYKKITGVAPLAGNKNIPPPIRVGFLPAIDVNGIVSGYDGNGIKTIIPAKARAKITARLAAGQEPEKCLTALINYFKTHKPAGLRVAIPESGVGGAGFRVDPLSPFIRKAITVLDEMADRKSAVLWEGASIPVIASLKKVSGAQPVLVGFGHDTDCAHAPNESFSLKQMEKGFIFISAFISSLSNLHPHTHP